MINNLKKIIKDFSIFKNLSQNLDNEYQRDDFVIKQLQNLNKDSLILDAGCGSQRYRKYCSHLKYYAQDFGLYTTDLKKMIGSGRGKEVYKYGKLDYVGDIWDINEKESTFDAILCTEVLEHIPHPIKTIEEFNRLLKKGGQLILTAPSN